MTSGDTPNGLVVAILNIFAQKHKLTIKFIKVKGGSIPETGDLSEVDIIASVWASNEFSSDHFNESRSYYCDRMTWCVMKKVAIQLLIHLNRFDLMLGLLFFTTIRTASEMGLESPLGNRVRVIFTLVLLAGIIFVTLFMGFYLKKMRGESFNVLRDCVNVAKLFHFI